MGNEGKPHDRFATRMWLLPVWVKEQCSLAGYRGSLLCAAFSPDGRKVASGSAWSSDTTAKIWDVATGKCLNTLAHSDPVYCAAFSPDSHTVVTGSHDKTAKIWDVATGECLKTLTHSDSVKCAVFSPDGTRVATLAGYEVTVWDVKQGMRVWNRRASCSAITFSPDGTRLLGEAVAWNAQTGHNVNTLPPRKAVVRTPTKAPHDEAAREIAEMERWYAGAAIVEDGSGLNPAYHRASACSPDNTKIVVFRDSPYNDGKKWDVESALQNRRFFIPEDEQLRANEQGKK